MARGGTKILLAVKIETLYNAQGDGERIARIVAETADIWVLRYDARIPIT